MLTERLLNDDRQEEVVTVENEIKQLSTKQTQLETTLTTLRKTLAAHETVVANAKAEKNRAGAADIAYRKANYHLYETLYLYQSVPDDPLNATHFFLNEAQPHGNYSLDVQTVHTVIQQRVQHAKVLENLYQCTTATEALSSIMTALVRNNNLIESLQSFLVCLADNQIGIDQAVYDYSETLVRLEKLLDDVHEQEGKLSEVIYKIAGLRRMQQRCEELIEPPRRFYLC